MRSSTFIGSCTLLVMSDESTVCISSTPRSTAALLMRAVVDDGTMVYVASLSRQARGPAAAVMAWMVMRRPIGPASPRAPVGAAHAPALGAVPAEHAG